MKIDTTEQVSGYLRNLPAPLQDGRFIGRFLLAFEAILSGGVLERSVNGAETGARRTLPERFEGLNETLDGITRYFRPWETPDQLPETPPDFLPWLARWVAVELREDWSDKTRRKVIASIVPLYKLRGTCAGIEQAVRLCVSETADVVIDDHRNPYPYYFKVTLTVHAIQGPATIQQLIRKAQAAIDLQKPAHTYYQLVLKYPPLVLLDTDPCAPRKSRATKGIYVGRNTTLGSADMDPATGEKLAPPDTHSSD